MFNPDTDAFKKCCANPFSTCVSVRMHARVRIRMYVKLDEKSGENKPDSTASTNTNPRWEDVILSPSSKTIGAEARLRTMVRTCASVCIFEYVFRVM